MSLISLKDNELIVRLDSIKKVWVDEGIFRNATTYRMLLDGEDESDYTLITKEDYDKILKLAQ